MIVVFERVMMCLLSLISSLLCIVFRLIVTDDSWLAKMRVASTLAWSDISLGFTSLVNWRMVALFFGPLIEGVRAGLRRLLSEWLKLLDCWGVLLLRWSVNLLGEVLIVLPITE